MPLINALRNLEFPGNLTAINPQGTSYKFHEIVNTLQIHIHDQKNSTKIE